MKLNTMKNQWWLLALVWAAILTRGAAAEEALDAFPQSTAAVARLASLDKLTGGLKEMLAAVGPLATLAGPAVDNGLNEIFQVAGDGQAIDRSSPAYVAVFALEGEKEPAAWLVRTTDEAKLQRAVAKAGQDESLATEKLDNGLVKISRDGRDNFFGHFGPWVFYTHNRTVAQLLVFDRQQPTFSSVIAPAAKALLEAGDGAVVINAALLTEKYRDKLQEARERALRQINSLPDETLGGGGTGSANPQAAKKMYSDLAGLAFDAAADAQWAALRVNFSSAGVGVTGLLGVKPESAIDQLLAANPPSALDTLGLLPSGAAVYYGYQANYERLSKWSREWASTAYGDSPNAQKISAAIDQLRESGIGSVAGSFSLNPAAGVVTAALYQAEHPDKLRAALAAFQAAGQANTPLYEQKVELQPNAENYQNHSVDVATTTFEFKEVKDEGQRIGQKLMQKLFGGLKMVTRFTSLEGISLQVGGNDPKYLRETIDSLGSGERVLGLEEAFAKTRDQLGEQANLIALFNVPRLIVDIVGLIRDIPPFDMALAQAPFNFGAQPAVSFAGFSLATEPHAVRLQLFIPVEQPKGVMQIFGQGQ